MSEYEIDPTVETNTLIVSAKETPVQVSDNSAPELQAEIALLQCADEYEVPEDPMNQTLTIEEPGYQGIPESSNLNSGMPEEEHESEIHKSDHEEEEPILPISCDLASEQQIDSIQEEQNSGVLQVAPEIKKPNLELFDKHPFYQPCQKSTQVLAFLHCTTLVNTPAGLKAIYDIRPGDEIIRADGEVVPVRALLKTLPQVAYIRFGKGSLQCRAPNYEPCMDLYVSQTSWFLYKHQKAMDCENIMNGNSISRTTIEVPADCYLICTDAGDYIRVADIDILTYPWELFSFWYQNQKGKHSDSIIVAVKSTESTWSVL